MISGRAAVVSVIVHAAFAGWVVSAKPAPELIVEDDEAAPAIEVVFELEPVVTQEAQASTPDIAMATETPAAVQQFVPDIMPEPAPLPEMELKDVQQEPPPAPPQAADIELPPLPVLEPIQSADITPPAEPEPPAPVIEAPKEFVASVSPLAVTRAEAEKPSFEKLPESAQPVQLPEPLNQKSKPAAAPRKQVMPKVKLAQKREEKRTPVAKPAKPVAKKKAAAVAKPVKGQAHVAKLAGGKSKALASKKALAAAASRKAVASGGSAVDPGYKSRILAKLRAAKRAPKAAASGRVVLSFTVSRSGGLLSARIVKSGGHAALDQATLAMARAAAPFPAMPASMNRASMSFTVPVQYN